MSSPRQPGPAAPANFNFARDVFDAWATRQPDRCALWWVHAASGTERRYTFAELAQLSRRAAGAFLRAGIQPGDRVLILLHRVPQWWMAMLGLARLGAVPVPAPPMLTPRDVQYRLHTAGISAVVADPEGFSKFDGFTGTRFAVGAELPPTGWLDFDAALSTAAPTNGAPTAGTDPALLYFTSATTGEPKMVLHTQTSYGLAHRATGQLWLDLRAQDVHWNLSDPGWAKAAWSSFYGPWHQGACLFVLDTAGRFDPVLTLDTLAQFPITTWCAPPTALRLIVREDLAKRHFPALRHCVTAGEPLNPEVYHRWKSATGLDLYEAYGQTETVVLIGNFRCHQLPIQPGSMGRPNPDYDIHILDDDLHEVPAGHEGEIAIRIEPQRPLGLLREYWRNPEENARQFRGGYYLTGDRARRDPGGAFWFVGRKDDVIKSSGYRIGPFEVESALLEHAAVLDVAIVGKPDPLRGEIVKAYIVPRPGHLPGPALGEELQRHCKATIAPYKYPREIEFVTSLPKTISGKIRRVALRQTAAGQSS